MPVVPEEPLLPLPPSPFEKIIFTALKLEAAVVPEEPEEPAKTVSLGAITKTLTFSPVVGVGPLLITEVWDVIPNVITIPFTDWWSRLLPDTVTVMEPFVPDEPL